MPYQNVNNGDAPHAVYGGFDRWREIFRSRPEEAIVVPVKLSAGYGVLKAGTILSENLSAAGNDGAIQPYNPTTFTGAENHPGRAYIVANTGETDAFVYTTLEDSYKFAVGDDLIINDDTTSAENLGAITAIDRTTYPHMAKITATTAIGGTAFTIARKAYVCVEAGDSSNNYSDAVGILFTDVDTGTGKNAKGAHANMIIGNALLVKSLLELYDAAALADLSGTLYNNNLLYLG